MGLFARGTPAQRLAKLDARARAKASSAGIDTTGALAVSRWIRDSASSTMLVFLDRIDIHNAGEIGSVTRTGRGVTSVPMAEIASVRSAAAGNEAALYIGTRVGTFVFWTSYLEANALATLIRSHLK